MRDLRKQALLESGKTTSRKARGKALGTPSPASSRPTSRGNSRVGSRAGSRNVSDDEEEFSDTTEWSINSIDELIAATPDDDEPAEGWSVALGLRIDDICNGKKNNLQRREELLQHFNLDLERHFAWEEIKPRVDDLLPTLLKSVRNGTTERETVLALKALALMLITSPSDHIYDAVSGEMKSMIKHASHPMAKMAAIHALSIVTFYSGVTTDETENVMDFLLDIAATDGNSIDEADNGDVVVSALEEWGFLASQLDDLEGITETAMETFVDQLDSTDIGVQIAAGDNIALLFEKSYTEAESGEDGSDDSDGEEITNGSRKIKRYTVYRQQHQLEKTLSELAKASTKRMSRKDRKNLHLSFRDIQSTVEKPTRGPRYNSALDIDGREYGYRLKISIGDGERLVIDKWWKLHRLNALKRLLQGGLLEHFEKNEVVANSIENEFQDE